MEESRKRTRFCLFVPLATNVFFSRLCNGFEHTYIFKRVDHSSTPSSDLFLQKKREKKKKKEQTIRA
jgi:hypothetical protein